MKNVKVQVTRTVHQTIEIEVEEAKSSEEAIEKAIEMAGDYDFSGQEQTATYSGETYDFKD